MAVKETHPIYPAGIPSPQEGSPLEEEEANAQAHLLKALADPTRLRLLSLLREQESRCVGELVMAFTLEQATISHHLRILCDAGLITGHKRGLRAYYCICRERVDALVSWLLTLHQEAA